ncbi:ABC transporter permease [Pedobacter rhodius]|uniref:ABC transporter permease n=1 Tax=Pedobacter rhodius TaxID=3004098 RepID=A0ABT4KVF8_9SPHI|nr:ABC transporter permease [Pedobacter sp. SJ11]MCZ4222908.1 ABC transporter permease [Pedobacter sp. SJ11]
MSTLINILGLGIGLTACILLLLYVAHEWNFDLQSKNARRSYQVMNNLKDDKGNIFTTFLGSATALAPAIKQQIPEIAYVSRTNYDAVGLLGNGEKVFKRNFRFAEPDIFEVYDFKFIDGNPRTALTDANTVILTESTAKLLFQSTDVVNKFVRFENKIQLKITAVVKDMPDNSSYKPDYILPWALYANSNTSVKNPDWNNYSFITLLVLKPGTDPKLIDEKINALVKRNTKSTNQSYFIYSLNDFYLRGNFVNGKTVGGNIERLWLFGGLTIGILLIACINFINLVTAKSEKRAKEIAIKKTLGANRKSLVVQFLMESLVLTLIALALAVILAELLLPKFNHMLQINLSITYFNFYSWISLIVAVATTALVAGSYPAFYLSSRNPAQNLKRNPSGRMFNFSLRQVLVVIQFCFSIFLVIGAIVIYQQVKYANDKPSGFDKDVLVQMPMQGLLNEKYNLLEDKLKKSGAVESMAKLSVGLSHDGSMFNDIEWPGMAQRENKIPFTRIATTYNFIKTSGVRMISGRDFSEKYASDSSAVLLSQSAQKIMNLKNPIGQKIKIFGQTYNVIGLFNDFVWNTPYKSNDPLVVYFNKEYLGNITMRLNSKSNLLQNVDKIATITKALNPAYPVEIDFLSSLYKQKFETEQKLGILSGLFGGLTIFISCLGLYGLVAYSAEQRTKEIGIRKVLGASLFQLMQLLSFSFLKIISFAIIIAVPLSIYLMNNWLKTFEFHTNIKWWVIPVSATVTLLTALLTVSFQTYKSAKANPINALKYE